MPLPSWPEDVPVTPLSTGFEAADQDNVAEFAPDVGAPLRRQRSTAFGVVFNINLQDLSAAQRDVLMAFYRDTLGSGSLPFLWTDPETGEEVEAMFVERPRRSTATGERWSVTCRVMRLP